MSDSWDGHIGGLGEADLFSLVGQDFELKLPDGRTGESVLLHSDTHLRGSGVVPF
jgi:hypothetical protein